MPRMAHQGERLPDGSVVVPGEEPEAGILGAEEILESLPLAVLAVDRTATLSYTNPAARRLLKGRLNYAVGGGLLVTALGARRAGTSEDYPRENLPLRRALRGQEVALDDLEVQTEDGESLVLEVLASPLRAGDGSITGAVATFRDAGPGTEAARQRQLLAAIVGSTDDSVVSVDANGRITSWNRSAEELFGYTSDEVRGVSVAILFPPDESPDELMNRVLSGQRISHDVRRLRRDGTTVMVGESLSPVHTDEGHVVGVASIARDITARLEAERALAVARRQLQAQNRRLEQSNAELEQFAYIASHDLSEPLRAVAGMVTLLARRYKGKLGQDADEFIEFAVDGCARMRSMIDDILAYSRAGRVELHLAQVNLGEVVVEVERALLEQITDTGAEIRAEELPCVRADRQKVSQVLQNLVGNAVKFRRPDVAPRIGISATREERGWRVEVADNGIGVEPQFRGRIFRMFQRLHTIDVYPGSGIGLSIADRLVSRHGGRMGVDDNPSGGATFWFTIADDPEELL
jgi:PAS domain S-box-containing protein